METIQETIRKEQKFARQFVMAAVFIILVMLSLGSYFFHILERYNETLPTPYLIQASFIPILLGFMTYYFFRFYRFRIKTLKSQATNQ
ncbi:MAG TPA: hypothetical protein PK990_05420 [Salinivirgaceae bacterium]|nr:hypothetical protein [Salinivirgaceae bacterium]